VPKQPWEWRSDIQKAAESAYYRYGEDRGYPGIVPYEVLEAIVARESGGDETAINPTPMFNGEHATGLMQVVPGLGIAGAYETVTQSNIDPHALLNPDFNLEVGAIGLSEKALDIQRTDWFGVDPDGNPSTDSTQKGIGPDWPSVVQIGWFGAGYQDGYGFWQPSDEVTDGPTGINGEAYRKFINDYVAGFGTDTLHNINAGNWRSPSDPNRESWYPFNARYGENLPGNFVFDWLEGAYKGIKTPIEKGKDAVNSVDDLVDFVTDKNTWVRIGVIALGVAIIGVGTTALLL